LYITIRLCFKNKNILIFPVVIGLSLLNLSSRHHIFPSWLDIICWFVMLRRWNVTEMLKFHCAEMLLKCCWNAEMMLKCCWNAEMLLKYCWNAAEMLKCCWNAAKMLKCCWVTNEMHTRWIFSGGAQWTISQRCAI